MYFSKLANVFVEIEVVYLHFQMYLTALNYSQIVQIVWIVWIVWSGLCRKHWIGGNCLPELKN